jgi:predicted SprT family Zn-dependent metalloprotease
MTDPTTIMYTGLTEAYDYFNEHLFEDGLPHCLITFQRKRATRGYFSRQRFTSRDGSEIVDEIALNPAHFKDRTVPQILSTLAHEMCHLRQHQFGQPSRAGYHNKEWAGMMRDIGLIPSHNGEPGGRSTGQRVSHYIEQGGAFDRVCGELIASGMTIRYVELRDTKKACKKAESKTKYTCPACGLNAWGKPAIGLRCENCDQVSISSNLWQSQGIGGRS